MNVKTAVKEHKILLFPLQPELQYLCHPFFLLLHLIGLRGKGSVVRRPSAKHGRAAETRDGKRAEGRDFCPKDDQKKVLFFAEEMLNEILQQS